MRFYCHMIVAVAIALAPSCALIPLPPGPAACTSVADCPPVILDGHPGSVLGCDPSGEFRNADATAAVPIGCYWILGTVADAGEEDSGLCPVDGTDCGDGGTCFQGTCYGGPKGSTCFAESQCTPIDSSCASVFCNDNDMCDVFDGLQGTPCGPVGNSCDGMGNCCDGQGICG